jgi:hypothetical protein
MMLFRFPKPPPGLETSARLLSSFVRRRVRHAAGVLSAAPLIAAIAAIAAAGCGDASFSPGDASADSSTSAAEARDSARIAFSEVTDTAGLGVFRHQTGATGNKWFPETMGSGAGFLDYNGDGRLDVMLAGGGTWPGKTQAETDGPALWLFKNDGDGTFSNVTQESGLGAHSSAYGLGVAAADYDSDGDQDIYLTTLGRNLLFRNRGDGTFAEVGREIGLAEASHWSTSAVFFDADRDGHLDLYVGNYVRWAPGEADLFCSVAGDQKAYCTPENYIGIPSRFYHNDGDGTFTDWTERAGFLPAPGKTLGAVPLDYNDDGWPDLAVANDTEQDLLYENDGDGTFTEKGAAAGVAYSSDGKARAGMGIDAGVVDSTGRETIFVGNFAKEMIGVYRNTGDGFFTNRAAISQIGQPSLQTLAFGLFLLDVDFDRDQDLFVANGHVQPDAEEVTESISYRQPPQLFVNQGGGRFEEFDPEAGTPLARPMVARGAAYGDYDRDGDVDVLLTENGGGAHLLRNDLRRAGGQEAALPAGDRAGAGYLRIKLRGRASNRDGIGAEVVAVADGKRMYRRVKTGSSYLSQSELAVSFGLGNARRVDSLRVAWPSGQTSRFTDVAAGQEVRVTEGTGQLRRISSPPEALAEARK